MTMADILKAENHCPVCIQDRIFMQHHLDFDFKVDVGDHVGHCPCTPDLLPYQLKSGMAHHPKCKMSEQQNCPETSCPDTCEDCGHNTHWHNHEPAKCHGLKDSDPRQGDCPCTRTYESLVGFKYCPCNEWGSGVPIEHQHPYVHHFNCDGTGKLKTETQVETEMETELQLLVIDMGGDCVLKNEGNECQLKIGGNTVDIESGGVRMWRSTFKDIKGDLDGVKPVPRIERCDTTEQSYEIINIYGDGAGILYQTAYDALSELAGKPLPIWEGGKWEELGHIDDHVYNNTDLRVWRYSR